MRTLNLAPRWRGFGWMVIWGVSFNAAMLFNRALAQGGGPNVGMIVWARALLALFLFAPFVRFGRDALLPGSKGPRRATPWLQRCPAFKLQLLRGVFLAGAMGASYTSYRHLPVYLAGILGALGTLGTVILGHFILREHLSRRQWILITCACLGGVLIIFTPPTSPACMPKAGFVVLSLTGSACASMGLLIARILAQRGVPAGSTLFFGTSVPLALYSLGLWTFYHPLGAGQWRMMGVISACGALSQFAYFRALGTLPVSWASPLEYLRLCFLVPAAYFFFAELPPPTFYIGAPLVVGASLFLFHFK